MKSNKNPRKKRSVLGSRPYKNYSQEMLTLAVDMIQHNRMSSREAEKTFGIPRRTLLNKVKNIHMKPAGGQKKLTNEEEEKLANVLVASADYGSPMTKIDLKMLVFKYLEKNSRTDLFDGKLPSNTWIEGFLSRHKSKLTIRTTQNITKVRAEKSLEEMERFFTNLEVTLQDIPPTNILNYDETNLSDNPGNLKCVFRRGVKHPERILNSTKSCVSIMFSASAAGICLPTYVVYKSINLYSEWLEGGPDGTRYNCSKSGWFDTASFEDYFRTIVVEWAKQIPGPKVVIGDNLSSHINIEVVELCQKNNIRLVFLPPNSTHLTQPLDVAYFGPLKREWKKILLNYKLKNPGQTTLNKKHFPKLLAELLENMKHKESNNIISGFRATGIWPVNPRNVFRRIPEYLDDKDYGIDTTLLDYLKETRAPKPMQFKRSKKLLTEPGKSVCAADILTKTNITQERKKANMKDIARVETINKNQEEIEIISLSGTESHILNEITGEVIKRKATIKTIKYNMPSNSSKIHNLEKPALIHEFSNPSRLNAICINVVNKQFLSQTHNTNAQLSDISVLSKSKESEQNRAFVASGQKNLPKCLRIKQKPMEPMERKKRIIKRKKIKSKYLETSSESDIPSVADTDGSEYETFEEYVSACLQDIDNKENWGTENSTIPFGISDINYFATEVDLKEGDWIVVKFAAKKSLKHFVGRILYIKNSIPVVKFVRKVKNSKGGKESFSYPNVEDICEINRDDVEITLPAPKISRRGQIIFDMNLNNSYNIQ